MDKSGDPLNKKKKKTLIPKENTKYLTIDIIRC